MQNRNNDGFGNGYSLKYFNFLYKIFIPLMIFGLLYNFSNIYGIYVTTYDSNASLFYSITGNTVLIFTLFINLIMNLFAAYYRQNDRKREFVLFFLWRFPIDLIGTWFVNSLYSYQFPQSAYSFSVTSTSAFIVFLIMFVPNYLYFYKRIKKPIALSNGSVSPQIQEPEHYGPVTELDEPVEKAVEFVSSPKVQSETPIEIAPKAEKQFCGQCGAKRSKEQLFCTQCGEPL